MVFGAESEYDEGRLMRNTVRLLCTLSLALASLALAPPAGAVPEPVLEEALKLSPDYTTPVAGENGEPIALFADLNHDGTTDVAILTIAAAGDRVPSAAQLSDPGRLYRDNADDPLFIVEAHYAGHEAIITVELGRMPVFTGMSFRTLDSRELHEDDAATDGRGPETETALPVAIEVGFRHRSGSKVELIVFQDEGKVTRFSFERSRNENGFLADVDDDGTMEAVTAVRVPEAGRGFETFLELHELRDVGFVRAASIAVVRLTSDFLESTAGEMESEAWDHVLARIGFGDEVAGAGEESSIWTRTFRPVPDEDRADAPPFDYPRSETDVIRVSFPRIADNPFPAPYLGRSIRLVFRVDRRDGDTRFYETTVGLSGDPFRGIALAFLTEPETGK